MALIHPQSCECTLPGLDLFTVPPTQTAVLSGEWQEYYPIATLTDTGPIEFVIKGTEQYLDLYNSYIQIQVKVVKADGSPLTADDDNQHGPVNNFLHSLFSEVEVYVGGVQVTTSSNLYPYRAYLENLLSYDVGAKSTQLAAELFYQDTARHFNKATGDDNRGLKQRRNLTQRSKTVDMAGRLHVDLFQQGKFLLNKVDMRVRLIRSRDVFSLMMNGANEYRVNMVNASLFIRKATVNPAVQVAHERALEEATAKYPLQRVVMKTFACPAGQQNITEDNIFMAQMPKRLVVGLVDSTAFNGNKAASPFEFKHHDVNYLALTEQGKQIPFRALKPEFDNGGQYARSYLSLFQGLNTFGEDTGCNISPGEYKGGYALFCFDLSPSLLDGSQAELLRSGSLRLEIGFKNALTDAVHVIVYGQFDGLIEINQARQVLPSFGN